MNAIFICYGDNFRLTLRAGLNDRDRPKAGIRAEFGKAVADLRLMMMLNSDKFQKDSHDEGTEELKRLTTAP